ncbi:uncharacterized protein G2W53_008191 [Senna tora]|uniref:Uncharacterized protein n=1 Tax=Senna tora TaxID=362788 RepID=A0A834X7T8_9FABA|nr:uncharacterized protein G2W53_008191 [Senna tora]
MKFWLKRKKKLALQNPLPHILLLSHSITSLLLSHDSPKSKIHRLHRLNFTLIRTQPNSIDSQLRFVVGYLHSQLRFAVCSLIRNPSLTRQSSSVSYPVVLRALFSGTESTTSDQLEKVGRGRTAVTVDDFSWCSATDASGRRRRNMKKDNSASLSNDLKGGAGCVIRNWEGRVLMDGC